MKEIDGKYLSPDERASILWETLQTGYHSRFGEKGPEPFDALMFSIEYLAQMALALGDKRLLDQVKGVNNTIYSLHYQRPDAFYGNPDRLTWEARLAKAKERRNGHGIL